MAHVVFITRSGSKVKGLVLVRLQRAGKQFLPAYDVTVWWLLSKTFKYHFINVQLSKYTAFKVNPKDLQLLRGS